MYQEDKKHRVMPLVLLVCVVVFISHASLAQTNIRCPEKCLCFRTTVRCMFVQLNAIPRVPPETTILDLRFNKIRSIAPGAFRQLGRLNTLLLNNNHISRLQSGAFEGLERVRYLYLYKNRIRHIDRDVFKNLNHLEQLYLHFNDISSFQADTFSSLPSLQRLFLHNNRLQHVPAGAFRNLQSLRRLRLDSNALVCDCQMLWLAQMVKEKKDQTLVAATCEQPRGLQGKSVISLNDSHFHCVGMPQIREGPQDVEVSFGGTASFTCRVDGEPAPEIVWLHNNEIISEASPRYSVLNDGTLRIQNAQGVDAGFYECRATNPMGEVVSRKATVSMQHVHPDPSPALIIQEPQNQNVTEHSRLVLPCNVTGHPPPQITWSKEGGGLEIGTRIHVSVLNSLIFSSINRTDRGVYTCVASNNLGTMTASAAIGVYAPIHFTTEPIDQYVTVGQAAQFTCKAVGFPEPELSWLRNGLVLGPTPRVSISIGGEAIRLLDVSKADEEEYTCRANNEVSIGEAVANLYIRETLAPVIMKEPLDQTAEAGQREVRLKCEVEGLPAPTVVWKKDGYLMQDSERYKIEADGSLYVYNISRDDAGMYECSAQNSVGFVAARASLTVIEEPRLAGVGDEFFRESFLEANAKVNRALNMTLNQLFNRDRPRQPLPHELLRIFRFPSLEAREIARAAEKIEQTLQIVHRHVESGMVFNLTDFNYQGLLSPDNLELLTNLSGCLAHRRTVSCSDMCFHLKYRTIDGTCNNMDNPIWGSSLTGFQRLLPPIYENGFNSPVGWSKTKVYYGYFKPSPRLVSTRIMSNEASSPDEQCTHMLMQWGQFLDHDIDHALPSISTESFREGIDCRRSCAYSAPCFPIEIPYDDPRVYRHRCMEFTRSSAVCGSGMTSVFFNTVLPREQINQLTSFIDASQVYGSSYSETQQLRNFTDNLGEMRIGISMPSGKPLMPFSGGAPIDCRRDHGESAIDCFLAGDVRANEQTALLGMHTIWFREHNRIAKDLKRVNPHWDGDTIFHETRKILGSLMQHITYKHWLPHILGHKAMAQLGPYKGYDPTVNPTISNSFATAAFRFGHTLVNPMLHRLNATFQPTRHGHLPLHKAFFSPWRLVQEGGVDPLMRGLLATPAKLKKAGQFLNTELTEKLFRSAHEVALDLAAINIQRGRDHALPGYLEWRKYCNLSEPNSFDDLRQDIRSDEVRRKLHQLYGHPGNVDVWVGGLLEDVVEGGRVGPTLACILADQFRRLRDGDRFWYENPSIFKPEQLLQIRRMTLGRILCSGGDDIQDVTKNVFILPHNQQPAFVPCSTLPELDLRFWAECCKDCRNAGYFNSLIRTPGLRLRRSAEYSYKEDKEDGISAESELYQHGRVTFSNNDLINNEYNSGNASYSNESSSGISGDGIFYAKVSRSHNRKKLNLNNFDVRLANIGEENRNLSASRQYGFKTSTEEKGDDSVPDDLMNSNGDEELEASNMKKRYTRIESKTRVPIAFPEEPVSTFNRGRHQGREEEREVQHSSDGTEERIEGIEALVQQLLDTVQHLAEQVTALKNVVERRGRTRRTRTCTDNTGARRAYRETWQQDPCTRCSCRRKGARCRVRSCPKLECARQVTQEGSCCPTCN
uniref:Peroxidasin-like n=3 Tax=Hirondellea gigas TaxID=1518452 RepID=A0A2P2HZE6_9CRUS